MDIEARRDLEVLETVAQNERITQRGLAAKLGVAVGLVNLYLKRLARKGYIKCVNVRSNRILYLITPNGIAEKTRLTYEFMEYSLYVYREARKHLRNVLEALTETGRHRVAIYGTGEAAALAYLSLRELGLEPVAVFDGQAGGRFLGMPVRSIAERAQVPFDVLVVATLEDADAVLTVLEGEGIPREQLVTLRTRPGVEMPAAGVP